MPKLLIASAIPVIAAAAVLLGANARKAVYASAAVSLLFYFIISR